MEKLMIELLANAPWTPHIKNESATKTFEAGSNCPRTNLKTIQLFPTPESPRSTSCNVSCRVEHKFDFSQETIITFKTRNHILSYTAKSQSLGVLSNRIIIYIVK